MAHTRWNSSEEWATVGYDGMGWDEVEHIGGKDVVSFVSNKCHGGAAEPKYHLPCLILFAFHSMPYLPHLAPSP